MSAFKYQWNQTIDVGTAGLLSKQWTSIRHILSLLVTANACVHVTAYVAVRRSLSTTYTAVVLGLLLRQYVSYQFGVWAVIWHMQHSTHSGIRVRSIMFRYYETYSLNSFKDIDNLREITNCFRDAHVLSKCHYIIQYSFLGCLENIYGE